MPHYLRFLLNPHRHDKALRAAHLAAIAFLAALISSTAYRWTK
ncbi:hypothetical protein [Kitasatospora sp. NPDC127116]